MKLALPILAVALLAVTWKAATYLLIPAVVGLLALTGTVLLFALVL
jgi:hypothetical protein